EKLLLLKDRMNTETGRKIAEARHNYMEGFLAQFYAEWDGEL
ncbi:MAG: phosphohydrolase, partial [Flavobacterium sp.]